MPSLLRLAAALAAMSLPALADAGDPVRGDTLFHVTYRCTDCHVSPAMIADLRSASTPEGLLSSIQTVTDMRTRYGSNLGRAPTDLDDLAAYIAQRFGVPAPLPVVEYHHAAFDHYFITALPDEIAALDAGRFPGWARTGFAFKAYAPGTAGVADVCRFFSTAFAPRSSHFYTPFSAECATVQANAAWQYEGTVMAIAVAGTDGSCPSGAQPVYRLYNNGAGGAPNHRYIVDTGERDRLLAAGWLLEGNGPGFAFMCSPP